MYSDIMHMYLKKHLLANNLPDIQLLELCEIARMRNVKKGDNIYLAEGFESRIYLVLKGRIKVSAMDDSGNELIKEILQEGDVFGDVSLDGKMPEDEFAEALIGNSMICSFKSADFRGILSNNPALVLNFANQVTEKLRRLEHKHSNLVFKDAKGRLLSFFRDWANREGNRKGDKIVLTNYLTHNDIAGIISTSRQSVTTLLNELRDTGFLFYNRKKIELSSSHIWN